MKVIILASGASRRLGSLTENKPKCLIKIGGRAILGRIVDSFLGNKIDNLVITTGYFEEKIKKFMKNNYPQIKTTYVYNSLYESTNYIYSIWLAKDFLKNNDVIYMHSDLFYDSRLLKKIVDFKQSGVLVNKRLVPEKDFKARIKRGLVTEIGVDVFGNDVGFCLPIFKFLKSDFQKWLSKIDEFIKTGRTNCYAEDAFNEISDEIKLYPVYYDKEVAMEIDDFEDLKKAKEMFSNET